MGTVTGLYHLQGLSVQRSDIERLMDALSHRTPGGSTIWHQGAIGLGEGLSNNVNDHQSLIDPFFLVADARIDNREELIHKLGINHKSSRRITNHDLIVGAYARWGPECPSYLIGDFAFALWDAHKKQLFCARDHLGLNPFYYVHTPSYFAFASEIKPLLSLPGVSNHLNEDRVADYLMQMHEDTSCTFYSDIYRLPPAHSLTITPEKQQQTRYWALDPTRTTHFKTDADYAERFRELFDEAVRCRLGSVETTGTMLSGGLDSSAITCLARLESRADDTQPLNVFSLVFDDIPKSDERSYIEAVLRQGSLRPHYIRGDLVNPFVSLEETLRNLDEPFFTPNLMLYRAVYERMESCGISVVLDGFAGDHVVSHGDLYLTELASSLKWLRLVREIKTIAPNISDNRRRGYTHLLRTFVARPLLKAPMQRLLRAFNTPSLPPLPFSPFINPDLLKRTQWIKRAKHFGQDSIPSYRSDRKRQLAELTSGSLPGALEILNHIGAAHGISPRLPFTDRRVMEYCLSVPTRQKYKNGHTRVYAREGFRFILPEEIYSRHDKTYLHHSLLHGLYTLGKDQLDSVIHDRLSIAAPYVNVRALRDTHENISRIVNTNPSSISAIHVQAIWAAVVLSQWLTSLSMPREKITAIASNPY